MYRSSAKHRHSIVSPSLMPHTPIARPRCSSSVHGSAKTAGCFLCSLKASRTTCAQGTTRPEGTSTMNPVPMRTEVPASERKPTATTPDCNSRIAASMRSSTEQRRKARWTRARAPSWRQIQQKCALFVCACSLPRTLRRKRPLASLPRPTLRALLAERSPSERTRSHRCPPPLPPQWRRSW